MRQGTTYVHVQVILDRTYVVSRILKGARLESDLMYENKLLYC